MNRITLLNYGLRLRRLLNTKTYLPEVSPKVTLRFCTTGTDNDINIEEGWNTPIPTAKDYQITEDGIVHASKIPSIKGFDILRNPKLNKVSISLSNVI